MHLANRFVRSIILQALLCSALVCTALPQGQRSSTSSGQQPQQGVLLGGRALNAQTGEPLGKVEVRLFSGNGTLGKAASVYSARTALDGSFLIEAIPAGNYLLTLARRAFATNAAELSGLPSARPQSRGWLLTLRAGQSIRGVEIRMPPSAVITGQVVDEDGEPMTGVVVEAEQYRYVQGVKALRASGRATSDDRGIYRIYDLSPGRYFVKAQGRSLRARLGAAIGGMAPGGFGGVRGAQGGGPGGGFGRGGGMLAAIEESAAYPETYYPSARSALEAIPLQLSPGAEMGGIDFALAPSPTYSVSGIVSLPAEPGAPGENNQTAVFVSARPLGEPSFGDAASFAPANPRTGEFTLRNLMPGDYQLIARVNSRRRGGSTAVGAAQVMLANGPVDDVRIAIHEDVAIPGKVTLPSGYATDQLNRMAVIPQRRLTPVRALARVEANGEFSVTLSPAETPSFDFTNIPEGLYLKSLSLGGVDLLANTPNSSVSIAGTLKVELAADGASFGGSLRDARGNGIAGARLTLIPSASFASPESLARSVWKKTALSGDDGTFQITAIAPGRYRLYAFEDLDADPSFDADFLSNFGQRWKEVDLKSKESATVEVEPIPAAETALYLGETQ